MVNFLKSDLACFAQKYSREIGLNRPINQIWSADASPGDGCDPDGTKAGLGAFKVDIRQ